ncbi:MAG TPA: hypothetical protein VIF84_04910 [Candidatus Limnocylindrales bacterium]
MATTVAGEQDVTAAPATAPVNDAAVAPDPMSMVGDAAGEPSPEQPSLSATPVAADASAASAARSAASGRQPTRFLADLVRAMRSTAEDSRTSLVEALRADGTTSVEQIHARSAEEVEGLRRVADDDVTGIKDWSKSEVARIRAETEERIAERKQELELSLEGHAALIEREIEHVQARIAEYEAEMDAFFVRLDEVEDPSEFAAVASEMPEPPSLDEASAAARAAALDELIRETTSARVEAPAPAPEPIPVAEAIAEPMTAVEATEEVAATTPIEAIQAEAPAVPEPAPEQAPEAQPEPAAAAVDPWPAAEPIATAPVAVAEAEAPAPVAEEADLSAEGDPRLAALGLSADGGEADADGSDDAGIDALSEATIAARLGDASSNGASAPAESTTSVVVVGLVSVASVASFKRTLGKVAGVRSVGVSSGPEGEFVFKTVHDPETVLKDVIPSLPGFGARVVASGEGVVNVSARDPEAEG